MLNYYSAQNMQSKPWWQILDVVKKIIWVLVFGIMYLVLVYPMTRSDITIFGDEYLL